MDGIFPLMTNISAKELSMEKILRKYKYQPYIEKRHSALKSKLEIAPIYFKSNRRIEAFSFLVFVALMIFSLIERELRMAMKQQKIARLAIYPEDRLSGYPTTVSIFRLRGSTYELLISKK